jgi:ABC-type antimicrobial peptide transport system permease subunit
MVFDTLTGDITLAIIYTLIGSILGLIIMCAFTYIIPKIVDRLTPTIDDEKEILRGNLAVATYSGMITQAVIIGLSIIVASAIIAGIM